MEYKKNNQKNFLKKENKFKKKFVLYVLLSLLIIILWNLISSFLLIISIIYSVYRFIRAALTGFSCGHCIAHFIVSLGFVSISIFFSSLKFGWIPFIVLMFAVIYAKNNHKK